MAENLITVLMKRDGISAEQAKRQIAEAREEMYARLGQGEMPDDICSEFFGLEPDYLEDLI